jgi:hypothetical protein
MAKRVAGRSAKPRDIRGRFAKETSVENRTKCISNLKFRFFLIDHCYARNYNEPVADANYGQENADSFDTINYFHFSGKLKHLDSSRFVVELKTFLSNLKCYLCDAEVLLQDAIGVLPSGISGHRHLLRIVIYGQDTCNKEEKKTGPRIFNVNTKLATGIYKMYKSYLHVSEKCRT